MSRKICPICSQPILDEQETIPFKKRTAHVACFNSFMKVTTTEKAKQATKKQAERKSKSTAKPKVELKDGLTEEEYKDKQELFATIRRIQCSEEIAAKTYKLVSDYISKYSFTYRGIQQALVYFYEIKDSFAYGERRGDYKDCIGIVPYTYDEAQSFYTLGETTTKLNKDIDFNNIGKMYKNRVVTVKPRDIVENQINIEDIGN